VSGDPVQQRRFYETRTHHNLRPSAENFYVAKLVRELALASGVGARDRVLEIGAGFGRFTFDLLEHCGSVLALDLSPRALAALEATRAEREIPRARCETRCADLTRLETDAIGERFRFIVGFHILHHLPDVGEAVRRLATLLEPGGALAFVEPNRRNPLFLAQCVCCPDMPWAEEKGMFRLSARRVQGAFRAAGLDPLPIRRFGFFPPQVLNRVESARRLEARLERSRLLEPVLPFLLLRARAAGSG
jgi:SAM-dependent methyltransferase